MSDIYQATILDHYRYPRHSSATCIACTHAGAGHNPTCGDKISVNLSIADGKIADIAWTGQGCAISQAAMSLLSESVLGQGVAKVEALGKDDILALVGVPLTATRLKCALLSLETLHKALRSAV